MLRLAGRLVDGTITGATGPRTLADHIVPSINEGCGRRRPSGRRGSSPRSSPASRTILTPRGAGSRTTSKPYTTFPAFKAMLEREGVSSQVDIGLIGDEATARAKAQQFIDAGATELAIRESTGTPEEAERTRAFLKSLLTEGST